MKTVLPYCKAFGLLIAAYFVFAVLSCLLPDKVIKKNIGKSAPVLVEEGLYPKAVIEMNQCQMDNFTDALIMSQIYNIDRRHPITAAMRMIRNSEPGKDWDQPGLLLRKVNGEDLAEQHYARYWHGNSFLFRPFFLFMDFPLMRWILFVISTLLLVVLCCTYHQKAGLLKTLALMSGFVATCGFVTQFSMQFFPVLVLTTVTSLLLIKRDGTKGLGLLFFIVGSLTCYLDLLTTPLLTLGIPLAVMLSLKCNEGFRFKDNLLEIIQLTLLWGMGYVLTFVAKWALATLVLGENIFANAFDVGVYRMGADEFTRWDAVARNFKMLNLPMINIAALILIVFNVVRHKRFNYKKAILFLLIGLAPFLWYLVLSNHSYLHWWFTYRLQAITVVCLFFILTESATKTSSPS